MNNHIIEEDTLPQPYRFISKIVLRCVDDTMTVIHNRLQGKTEPIKEYRDSMRLAQVGPNHSFCLPKSATAVEMVGKDIAVGTSDGTVTLYSSIPGGRPSLTTPLLDCGGPIISVTGTIHQEGYATYAALGAKGTVVFAFVPADTSAGTALDQIGEVFTVFAYIPMSALVPLPTKDQVSAAPPSPALSLALSIEGKYVSVLTATHVYIFCITADFPAKVAPPVKGALKPVLQPLEKPHQIHAAPDDKVYSNVGIIRPAVSYIHHSAPSVLTGQPSDALRSGPQTYALYVTWLGTTCFTSSTLLAPNPYVGPFLARFQEMASSRQVRRPDTSEAAPGAGGKAPAKADLKKAPAAAIGAASGISGAAEMCPLPYEDVQPSLRYTTLPNFACAVATSKSSQTIAFACAEGTTWVWNTRLGCVVASIQMARHRTRQLNHRAMLPTFVTLYDDTHVIVNQSVLGVPNSTTVVCYSITGDDVAKETEISKLKGLPTVLAARTHPELQFTVLRCGDRKTRVFDMNSGHPLAILTLSSDVAPSKGASPRVMTKEVPAVVKSPRQNQAPKPDPRPKSPRGGDRKETSRPPSGKTDGTRVDNGEANALDLTHTLKEALHRRFLESPRGVWFYEDAIVLCPLGGTLGDQTIHIFSSLSVFSAAYPNLGPTLFGYEQLASIIEGVPHAERDANTKKAPDTGSVISTKQPRRLSQRSNQSRRLSATNMLSMNTVNQIASMLSTMKTVSATYTGDPTNGPEYVKYLIDARDLGQNARRVRMKAKLNEWKIGGGS